jgi:predicted nucleic acid-binding Zn ribbon protein
MTVRRRRRRGRFIWFLALYLLVVAGGAIALWLLIPAEVKKAVYETYVNPP